MPLGEVRALMSGTMMYRILSLRTILLLAIGLLATAGCRGSQPNAPSESPQQQAEQVPADLQATVDKLVQAAETFDIPHILDSYAEDFRSGTGRTKDGVREVFTQLKERHVTLQVEKKDIEKVEPMEAVLRTQLRLRYKDRFRDLGDGEVVVTDVLKHSLRKEQTGWKIYADTRVSTYREGRFGPQPPNVQLNVPESLPEDLEYPITVTVRPEQGLDYQVMVGNYVEDPSILPPPDIVTSLPEDGVLHAQLIRNPQGRSEMVRITIITVSSDGEWIGATTISKFVPGITQQKKTEDEQEFI